MKTKRFQIKTFRSEFPRFRLNATVGWSQTSPGTPLLVVHKSWHRNERSIERTEDMKQISIKKMKVTDRCALQSEILTSYQHRSKPAYSKYNKQETRESHSNHTDRPCTCRFSTPMKVDLKIEYRRRPTLTRPFLVSRIVNGRSHRKRAEIDTHDCATRKALQYDLEGYDERKYTQK